MNPVDAKHPEWCRYNGPAFLITVPMIQVAFDVPHAA